MEIKYDIIGIKLTQESIMEFKESFSVIADNHKPDDYTKSIAFMKSFGLKYDSVGWATITLDDEEKFDEMIAQDEEPETDFAYLGDLVFIRRNAAKKGSPEYYSKGVIKSKLKSRDNQYTKK